MKIHIYKGGFGIVGKSGVGQAILHQQHMLDESEGLFENVSFREADIVHINTVFPDSPIVALTAKKLGKKVVCYGHSTMEDFKNSFVGSNRVATLFKQWIRLCYSLGDVIVTPTEYSKELLESYGFSQKIVALSNGVDTDTFSYTAERRRRFRKNYGIKDEEQVIISVGHLIERKGILDFIRMAKEMPQKRFLWFGHTDRHLLPQNIRNAIDEAPENLTFPGYVSQQELRDAYCGCDIFAFTSFEETEGIVVLEALACGANTIVRDIPVYADWLTDKVNVYKAKDAEGFVLLCEKLSQKDIPSLSKEGRKVAESRSLGEMQKQLEGVYRYCLENTCKVPVKC